MNEWIDEWMNEQTNKWIDGWMNKFMNEWMMNE